MSKDLLSQKNIIIAVIAVVVIFGGGYYGYSSFTDSSANVSGTFQADLLKGGLKDFYAVKDSIDLSDSFMKGKNKVFFDNLEDNTQDISLKKPAGRANPFVPNYVAP